MPSSPWPHRLMLAAAVSSLGLAAQLHGARAATCTDVLNSTRDLSSFAAVVQLAGLAPLVGTAPVTVFAPTNTALSHIDTVVRMLEGQSANKSADYPKLQTLVRAHVVRGLHPENEMHGKVELTTAAGTTIAIDGTTQRGIMLTSNARSVNLSGFRTIPDVHVSGSPITCDNGLVYRIDDALVQ